MSDAVIGMLRRGTLVATDDGGSQQLLKKLRGLKGESFDDVYRPQPHGLSSHAPNGSEGLLLSLGGRSDRLIGLGFEHKDHRPTGLPAGATVLYDASGNTIFVKGANGIRIKSKVQKITITPADDQNVYLGGDPDEGGVFALVSTVSGPAVNVFAKIG